MDFFFFLNYRSGKLENRVKNHFDKYSNLELDERRAPAAGIRKPRSAAPFP